MTTMATFTTELPEQRSSNDLDSLHGLLFQLTGQPFLQFRLTYADELTLHFGTPQEPRSPKLRGRLRGSVVLSTRASLWFVGTPTRMVFSNPKSMGIPSEYVAAIDFATFESMVKPGIQVVSALPHLDDFGGIGLLLSFSDQTRIAVKPRSIAKEKDEEAADLPEIADWELYLPNNRCLKVGPGLSWSFLRTDKVGE